MFTEKDKEQIMNHGLTVEQVEKQVEQFKSGFPFLRIRKAAELGKEIMAVSEREGDEYVRKWREYKAKGHRVVKFVPASGAATRMFKDLYAFRDSGRNKPETEAERTFFARLHNMGLYDALCDEMEKLYQRDEGKACYAFFEGHDPLDLTDMLLDKEGLNYGALPKGLLLFHKYEDKYGYTTEVRTAMEEHLVEAAMYGESGGEANVHFTVSHEHLELFKEKVQEVKGRYEERFGVRLNVSFSEQKPSTDTIAVNMDNTPFRNADGSLLFRPAGHGALIENLNEIDADVVFIKNIDNVVPDRLKGETVRWKEILAGVLVENMERYDVPVRVCGVVKNVGEPGGGPFVLEDGSLQILESSQIDKGNEEYVRMFKEGTHFNPVDLVCGMKDREGRKYDLRRFVDGKTGFISQKSKDGRELKALELPGLWNGAMSGWKTIFVEVPLGTFNPVKTVNDLGREEHR